MNLIKTLKTKPNIGKIRKLFLSTGATDDFLILHTYSRNLNLPTISPFCLTLETYLRMADISYTPNFHMLKYSPKDTKPVIEHNGNKLVDVNVCIKYINKEFGIDFDSHLSEKEKGFSQIVIRIQENLLLTMIFNRWVDDLDFMKRNIPRSNVPFINKVLLMFASRKAKQYLHDQGLGRHNKEEMYKIAQDNISLVSKILGTNSYVVGDKPCVADACIFGIMAQFIWDGSNSPQHHFVKCHENILQYCNNIRNLYWPDFELKETR